MTPRPTPLQLEELTRTQANRRRIEKAINAVGLQPATTARQHMGTCQLCWQAIAAGHTYKGKKPDKRSHVSCISATVDAIRAKEGRL